MPQIPMDLTPPTVQDSHQQTEVDHVVQQANLILVPLLRTHLRNLDRNFDPSDKNQLQQLINRLSQMKKSTARVANTEEKTRADQCLEIAKELLKINQLVALKIPHDEKYSEYCTLAESARGVTEKVSLVSLATVMRNMKALIEHEPKSIDDYITQQKNYSLSTEAILKLPKHGRITEVQREALALGISRILGQDTTSSALVSHEGKPALFVPFEEIQLMSEFAEGKKFKTLSKKEYQHYSTITPVGAGLQSNEYIQDFGHSLGLTYLCSDTDFMGGYNQNKALRNARSLYIFDQVIMPKDKLKLDSRLSLKPCETLMKHTRHGRGRNRTLIEDSSVESKYKSLMHLVEKKKEICDYVNGTMKGHEARMDYLKIALKKPNLTREKIKELKTQYQHAETLRNDARQINQTIVRRINKIMDIMPKIYLSSPEHQLLDKKELTQQALILEKLLHNPRLFTSDGRPYRNPWTEQHKIHVKNLVILDEKQPGEPPQTKRSVVLTFDGKVPAEMVDFIKQYSQNPDIKVKLPHGTQIKISMDSFRALKETMLYPESQLQMQETANYVDVNDLEHISKAYGKAEQTSIIRRVTQYSRAMENEEQPQDKKLQEIRSVLDDLQTYINTATDKGFGKQVMKKIHFDIHKHLRSMILKEGEHPNLDKAFFAALKLDQVALFNQVVTQAIEQKKINTPAFTAFLELCINKAEAKNHTDAVLASKTISDEGNRLLRSSFEHEVPVVRERLTELEERNEHELNKAVSIDEDEPEFNQNPHPSP